MIKTGINRLRFFLAKVTIKINETNDASQLPREYVSTSDAIKNIEKIIKPITTGLEGFFASNKLIVMDKTIIR